MGKGLKIVCVGLPMFTERLVAGLTEFDKVNKYIGLDTYYNKKDQLKALYHIPRADCLFSINGTIRNSRAFDLAFKKKVPVVMNWVGTDVLKAIDAYQKGEFNQDYIDRATHFCEVGWIQEELKTIGINASISNFASFDKKYESSFPEDKQLKVLTYIPNKRSVFYGMNEFLNLAKKNEDISFEIAGTKADEFQPLPKNVNALGWVGNMEEVFNRSHVCLRYTEHDGLSTFILEALARGKHVLYKNEYKHCLHCPDEKSLEEQLLKVKEQFDAGRLEINKQGVDFIETTFNNDEIYGNLIQKIEQIAK